MSERRSMLRLAVIAVAVVAVIGALWWRRGGGGDAERAAAPIDDGAARGPALPRRGTDDGFGAQFRRADGQATVQGRVVDAVTRAPVAHVDVLFGLLGGEWTATSDDAGAFAITLPSGEYEVRAVGDRVYAPPRRFLVGRVDAPLALEVEVSRLAVVRGRVVDAGGAPVGGAQVAVDVARDAAAVYEKDALVLRSVETDGAGGFEIGVMPGDVRLTADAPAGHARTVVAGVPPGGEVGGVELRLAPYATVAGVVRRPDGGYAEGATVQAALRLPGTSIGQALTATAGPRGEFRIEGLISTRVTVEAYQDGLARSAPQTFWVDPGQVKDGIELVLGEPRTVAGRVVDADGAPVFDARVKLERVGSRLGIEPVRTDADGRFAFTGVDAGPFTITADQRGLAPARVDNVTAPAELELVMPATAAIRGTVTDAAGQPVRALTVGVAQFVPDGAPGPARPPAPAKFASDDGRFELTPVAPGTYNLVISAPGYAPGHRDGVVVAPGAAVDASIQLGAAGAIVGTVTAGGQPVAGAQVVALSGHAGGSAYTDTSGRYRLDGVAPGRRSIAVARAGVGEARVGGIEVGPGEATVDVDLTESADEAGLFGIGVVIQVRDGTPVVTKILRGTPAASSRLRVGDAIVSIDGAPVGGLGLGDVLERIRSSGPGEVVLVVERAKGARTVKVPRGRIRFGPGEPVARVRAPRHAPSPGLQAGVVPAPHFV